MPADPILEGIAWGIWDTLSPGTPVPQAARRAAADLERLYEILNDDTLRDMTARAKVKGGDFGALLAKAALGPVPIPGWIKIPTFEVKLAGKGKQQYLTWKGSIPDLEVGSGSSLNPEHTRRWTPEMVDEDDDDDKPPAERLQWIPRGKPAAQRRQRIPIVPGENPGRACKAGDYIMAGPGWSDVTGDGDERIRIGDTVHVISHGATGVLVGSRVGDPSDTSVMVAVGDHVFSVRRDDITKMKQPHRNPRATFTAKGERMYEDIKRGYGKDKRASEIAARTVYARARDGVPGLIKRR